MDPEPAELFNVLMQRFYPVRGGILGAMRSSGASQQSGVAERDLEVSWNSWVQLLSTQTLQNSFFLLHSEHSGAEEEAVG